MKNRKKLLIRKNAVMFFFIILFIISIPISAQTKKDTTNIIWAGIGVGACDRGISEHLSFNLSPNKLIITVRYTRIVEFSLFSDPIEKINEINYLMGLNVLNSNHIKIRLQGGFGILSGTKKGEYLGSNGSWFSGGNYKKEELFTVGIPLEISFDFCGNHAGFGISGYANINDERPFAGIALKLLIGKLN